MTNSKRLARTALVAAGCAIGCRGPDEAVRLSAVPPRGVVLVVVDTLRADHVGAYGSSLGLTPNLDAVAARSFVFENAVATSSWTRPSVASMLTSRYPTALGIHDGEDTLDGARFTTLPAILKRHAGFQTFGTSTNGNTSADFGFGFGFDEYELPNLKRSYPDDFAIPIAPGVTQRALELLDRRDGKSAFFLFVHYVDPHDPYLPHPGLVPEPEPGGRFDGSRRELSQMDPKPPGELHRPDYDRIKHLYAGEVRYFDLHFGELLKGLRDRGLEESVLMVVTSDHGEGLWDHGIRFHGVDLYEETTAVPLIVRYPGMSPGDAKRIPDLVSLVDLAPTVLSAFGIPNPDTFQGQDLTPLMAGRRRLLESEYVYAEMDRDGRSFDAVRKGSWKLIRRRASTKGEDRTAGEPERQLFDLERDPGEKANRAGRESGVEERFVAELRRRVELLSRDARWAEDATPPELGPATIESLKALGYLEASKPLADVDGKDSRNSEEGARSSGQERLFPPSSVEFEGDGVPSDARGLQGFRWTPGGDGPWIGFDEEASVLLRRASTHERWSVSASLDPARFEGGLRVTVRIQGLDASGFRIEEPGVYTMEGDLPPMTDAQGPLRLSVACEDPSAAAAPPQGACMTLSRIGLY